MQEHVARTPSPNRHHTVPPPTSTSTDATAATGLTALAARQVLELQRLAGNSAMVRSLQRSEEGTEDDDY